MIRVLVWNEYYHERISEEIRKVYPNGIHNTIADFLKTEEDLDVKVATMEDPEFGLSQEALDNTDVLIWWAHVRHHEIPDEIVNRVKTRVLGGMGFIPLHSSHYCKPFGALLGTTCSLRWREGDRERVWNVNPGHPIAQGVGEYFELEHEEMYGEHFDIPEPDELVFIGWFKGGEVFRSGACFKRGYGKIFYFQPGHEEYPTYYNETVQRVIKNAVHWAAPTIKRTSFDAPCTPSPEAARE